MPTGPRRPRIIWSVVAREFSLARQPGPSGGSHAEARREPLTLNPEWARMQQQLTDQEIQRLNANTRATIAATQAENAREQQMMRNMQRENENFNDVINGVTFTRDPQTGQYPRSAYGSGRTLLDQRPRYGGELNFFTRPRVPPSSGHQPVAPHGPVALSWVPPHIRNHWH